MTDKNEIDFVLTTGKNLVKNVEVLNRFEFEKDHRMVRITLNLKSQVMKAKFKKRERFDVNILDSAKILRFNNDLKSSLKQASNDNVLNYKKFETLILSNGSIFKSLNCKHQVLTSEVKQMIVNRENLRREAQRDIKFKDNYIYVRRETKNAIRRDVKNYNLLMIDNAIRNNQGLKVARQGIEKKKNFIQSLIDKHGIEQIDQENVLKVATKFYKKLYESNINEDKRSESFVTSIAPTLLKPNLILNIRFLTFCEVAYNSRCCEDHPA